MIMIELEALNWSFQLLLYIRHDFGHVKSRRQKRPSHHAYLEQCQHDNREEIQFTEKQLEESSPANYK